MSKEYAIEILECVERATLEKKSSLAKEAFAYLKKLKTIHAEVIDRIYKIEHGR
jgi:hypothetical protein